MLQNIFFGSISKMKAWGTPQLLPSEISKADENYGKRIVCGDYPKDIQQVKKHLFKKIY